MSSKQIQSQFKRSLSFKQLNNSSKSSRGFTLIELMIALSIAAIGLMGQLQVQMDVLSMNKGNLHRTQATFLANEIAARMQMNTPGVAAGLYDYISTEVAYSTNSCISNTSGCTVIELTLQDIYEWTESVGALIPNATATVTRLDSFTNQPVFEVSISWNGSVPYLSESAKTQYNTFKMEVGV